MPSYDYQCEGSERIFEVQHPMALTINNWAELCKQGGFDINEFPQETPVHKVIGGNGGLVSSAALKNPEAPPCMSGGGCPGGSCGI